MVRDSSRAWVDRRFQLLVTGRGISFLGNGLAHIAVAFAVLDLTGSATDLGIVLAARSTPQVLFLLFGGVLADRLPRARVVVVASVVSGASQAVAAVLVLHGDATVASLAAIEAINGAASAFVFPASSGLIPQTVPAAALQQANVVLRLVSTSAMIGGPSAGGVLVAAVGPGWGLAVYAATFLVSALCFAFIKVDPTQRLAQSRVWVELREGWDAFRTRTWLWVIVLAFGLINAAHAAGWSTLGPVIADDTFGRKGWGFVLAAETAGMFLAGLVLLRVRFRRPLFVGMLGVLAWSPLLLFLAAEPRFALLFGISLAAGAGVELFGLGWDLSMQQHVPAHLLSRVYSYDALGSFVAIPIGQLLAGPLANAVGVNDAVTICGVAIVAAGVASLLVPSVRNLERVDVALRR